MARQFASSYGVRFIEDSTALGIPLVDMNEDGGDMLAINAAKLLEIVRRFISVKDFGAIGDGIANDTAAIQSAVTTLKAVGQRGVLYFPAGTYLYNSPIVLDTDYMTMCGDGVGRTFLRYSGAGKAIQVTASQRVILHDFKLNAVNAVANSTIDGICIEYPAASTGYGYTLKRLEVVGFSLGAGIAQRNLEHSLTEQVHAYGCKNGFLVDASAHTSGNLGINNRWAECRSHDSVEDGWDVASQSSGEFINGQSFSSIAPPTAHFRLRGTCVSCKISGLDVEYHGVGPAIGTGIQVSGTGHNIQVNAFFLAQAIRCSTCTTSFFPPQRFVSCLAGLSFDSGSATNRFVDTGYQISDSGNGNRPTGGGTYRAVTGATTVTSSDRIVDCTSGTFTVTLPSAARLIGPVTIYNNGAGTITVGGTVSGVSNPTLAAGKYLRVDSTGSTYLNIGSN